ncbi:PREDICTED: succinate dehydrogenase assembly factor 4, mitochondrial [Nanorana parkeri]|uniref:succinate dehydrogenase assembly factor 4, mitochondrial n=1 Tax=Nanorana parkeri TaxID=125878 RepID=UPI000854CB2E|nr:PREDICTED: succinate dehydrogenase assembly factor 4, mitochondrial [Nanorana parkeri]
MSAVRGMVGRWSRCVLGVINEHLAARPSQSYTAVWSCVRAASRSSQGSNKSQTAPLKKPKTPQGRFDETEQSNKEKEPLERFPGNINPVTKEKGGPRGPEPTRYGDWERKGRCIDF